MARVLRFFLAGLREKARVALAVGAAVFAATVLYTFTRPKVYEATTTFNRERRQVIRILEQGDTSSSEVRIVCGPEELNTDADVIESTFMARRVARRISVSDQSGLLAYAGAPESEIAADERLVEALKRSRRVHTAASGWQIKLSVRHPDPAAAARIATLYGQEVYAWLKQLRLDELSRAIADLALRIRQARERLREMEPAITAYRAQLPPNPATNASDGAVKGGLEASRAVIDQLVERHTGLIEYQSHILDDLTVIPAEIPALDAYVEPDLPRYLGTGLLAGFVLGVTTAAVAARRDP